MDPKLMADLIFRDVDLYSKNLAAPSGKFKFLKLFGHQQAPYWVMTSKWISHEFILIFCTFWCATLISSKPRDNFQILSCQMKLAVFLEAIWAPLGSDYLSKIWGSLHNQSTYWAGIYYLPLVAWILGKKIALSCLLKAGKHNFFTSYSRNPWE